MTIEEAKQVRIVDFLAQLGHHAQYIKSDQYWYLSPLRDEQSPSFKVNDRLNEWYDFGAATGGDLVELGKYLYQTESVSEVLAYIGRHSSDMPLPKVRFQALPPRPVESDMKNLIVVPLRHHALYSYLQSRKIDADIGRMFCKEIHYELRDRHYVQVMTLGHYVHVFSDEFGALAAELQETVMPMLHDEYVMMLNGKRQ